ncbi:response regulator transcription factor [Brevundimonas goettingensis]|uniref:Response regulator transcription factor n=1 Tax=Brevundimonas goettingensis TaxID=2774190 RepID=A0A975GW45_9CAUL|nr:response regulator [Brevundimonas goettingensis]QTC92216.1 response regulator transcription factor [Brevundimonas goettingensis]
MTRSVVIIDDDADVLESLEAVFASAGYAVRAFASADAFLAVIETVAPACIVTDLRMPGMDGLDLVRTLQGCPQKSWPIIVLSGHADVADAVAAMRAGAVDFLTKPAPPRKLLEIVDALSVDLVTRSSRTDLAERYATLSPREREVVELIALGATSKTAALALGLSPRTVDIFRGRILRKMGVENVTALAAALTGLVGMTARDQLD